MRLEDSRAVAAAATLAALLGMALLVAPSRQAPAPVRPHPALLARLGSRLTVVPAAERGTFRILPLGLHLPEVEGLRLTARLPGADDAVVLPGARPDVRQKVALTSLTFTSPLPGAAADVSFRVASPFCPGLPLWRDAPVMLLRASVHNRTSLPLRVSLHVDLLEHGGGTRGAHDDELLFWEAAFPFQLEQTRPATDRLRRGIAAHLPSDPASEGALGLPPGEGRLMLAGSRSEGWRTSGGGLELTLAIPPHETAGRDLVLAFHTSAPVHIVDGTPRRFAYAARFSSADDLARRALVELPRLGLEDRRTTAMTLLSSEPPAVQRLAPLAFQTFLANTWLLEEPGASFRYSEWEGYPRFHATLDVVFNNAPFHALFAPDLLADLLRHWPAYGDGTAMPHDVGQGLVIGATAYPSRMPVEEDASFLLLHHVYAHVTGDVALAVSQRDLLREIALRILASDGDADGLPDRGVVNTFDDAPFVLNAAPNQLYLGIKAAAALHAYVGLAPHTELTADLERRISDHLDRAIATVHSSWLGDHYPVVRRGSDVRPPRRRQLVVPKGHAAAPTPTLGRPDGYTGYLAHGLVPLLMTGDRALARAFPHMAAHLEAAHARTLTRHGNAHTDDVTNVWISQNLWRDAAALYLGARIDTAELAERYWELQLLAAERKAAAPWWEAFCDSPENELLTSYSRGASVLLLPWARRGITWDRLEGQIGVPPRWRRGRLDLPFAADWEHGRVPALTWGGSRSAAPRRTHGDLLDGVEIR